MKEIKLTGNKSTQKIELETPTCDFVDNASSADVLGIKLNNEITRAIEAEKDLDFKIDAETSRAIAREDELESQIKQSGKVDDVLVDDISVLGEDKIARIDLTPYAKESDLSSEISRAKESESSLDVSISEVRHDLISEAIRAAYLTASRGQTIVCGFKIKDIISPTAIDIGYVPESEGSSLPYRDWIVEWAQAIIDNIDDLWVNGFEEIGEFGADLDACVEYFQEIIDNVDEYTASMLNTVFQKFVKHWDILKKYPGTLQTILEFFTYPGITSAYGNHFIGKSTGDYINRIENGSSYYIDDWDDNSVYFKYVDKDGTETDITISNAEFKGGAFFFEIINTLERAYTPEINLDSLSTDTTYDLTDEQYSILSNTGYGSVNVVGDTIKLALTFHRAFSLGNLHIFTHIQQDESDSYYHTYTLWINNRKAHFTEGALPTRDELLSEISSRETADKTLQSNIDANKEAIASETTRATDKETELENAIKEAGKIDDVKVNDVSVVTDKVANIDLTSYATIDTDQTITGEKTIANDFNTQSILPTSAGTYSLGSDDLYYKDLYLNNITIPSLKGEYKFVFKATDNGVSIGNADYKGNYMEFIRTHDYGISLYNTLEPNTDDKWSLGAENYRFKDLYLSGSISDKTNSITVSEIVAKQDKLTAGDNIAISDDNVISSDLSAYAKTSDLDSYVKKTGDIMIGTLTVPEINSNTLNTKVAINTGTNANSYFQAQKFRGQGNASTYNHAIDFGYAGHDRVDFYEYGGVYNFWQNQGSTKLEGDRNRVASLQLGKLLERGYTLTYPGKSGTFALTSDFADYATIAYVDEKTTLPKITITKDQFESSTSVKLTDEQNAILIDTNNDAVLVDLSAFGGTYPKIVLHRQISSPWLLLFTSIWNAEMLTLENGVGRLKRYLVATGINDGVQPTYPTASIIDLDTIDFPTITLTSSQVTSISEDGNSMTLKLTDNQYNILCDSLYRAVKIDASGIGLWNDGVIYKLNDDSTEPVYTFFSVSSSDAGIGRIFVNSDKTVNVYITYAASQEDYSKHIHDSVVSNGDGTYMLVFGAPGTGD